MIKWYDDMIHKRESFQNKKSGLGPLRGDK